MLIKNKQDEMFRDLLIDFAEACTILENILEDDKLKDADSESLIQAKDFIKRMDEAHTKME